MSLVSALQARVPAPQNRERRTLCLGKCTNSSCRLDKAAPDIAQSAPAGCHPAPPSFLFLHPDSVALRTLPFAVLVIDVALQFIHRDFAVFAGHDTIDS